MHISISLLHKFDKASGIRRHFVSSQSAPAYVKTRVLNRFVGNCSAQVGARQFADSTWSTALPPSGETVTSPQGRGSPRCLEFPRVVDVCRTIKQSVGSGPTFLQPLLTDRLPSVSSPLSFQAGRGLFSNPNRGRFGDFLLGIGRVSVRSFKNFQSRWRSASRRASTALQEGNWPKHKARHWDSYSAANAIARLPVGNRALLLAKVIPGGAT